MADTKFVVDKENLEVRITRTFNATPERMWKAFTDPAEIEQWWADTKVEQNDFKVGGKWRYVSGKNSEGQQIAFSGEFKEIDEPKKISRTFGYEPMPGHVLLETVIFEPQGDGKTMYKAVSKYANLEDLEGMVGMGMERGATAGLDRLAKVVEN